MSDGLLKYVVISTLVVAWLLKTSFKVHILVSLFYSEAD